MNSALNKNIDEYDDPHDLEVEYQYFLSELHEWLPESCDSFGKMMSHISSSAQLNMIDELRGFDWTSTTCQHTKFKNKWYIYAGIIVN